MRARTVVATAMTGAAATVAAQVFYVIRRDLPSVYGASASGFEGHDGHPLVRIGAAGDSTLTGPGLADPRDIWIRRALSEVAGGRSVRVELVSYAVGGSKVADVLRDQLDGLLAMNPDLAIIVVGTNDAIHHTPLRALRRDFDRVLERVAPAVDQVVLGGVGDLATIARVPWPLAGLLRLRGRRVDRTIRAAAARHANVHYVEVSRCDRDFAAGGARLFAADLFHPNERGHAVWAAIAVPAITAAIDAFRR